MAETIDELTIQYEEDGQILRKQLDKEVLSKGSWATIMFRWSRGIHDVSSDADPRCTTSAFCSVPVARSADAKPSDIDMRTAKTATTSAMPETASSVTCQRFRTFRTL